MLVRRYLSRIGNLFVNYRPEIMTPLNFNLTLLLFCFLWTGCGDEAAHMKELSSEANAINEKCPRMLDSETRFDGVEVKEPNTVVYRYSLVNVSKVNIDTVLFYRALWPGIISTVKASVEMKKMRDHNTLIEYYYQDRDAKGIYTFRIGPGDYK